MTDADTVSAIEAESKKEVAAIEAVQKMDAESASTFMTTLDKLQEFKRYTLALVVLALWGVAISLIGVVILVLVWKAQYDPAIEAAKWLIALVGMSISSIIGFYFGSNQQGNNAG